MFEPTFSITILNSASDDVFLLLEGSTHALLLVDISIKRFLLESSVSAHV